MKGNDFLNPRNFFWNPRIYFLNLGNYFFNPRNYFFNLGNYFLNPRIHFLICVLNPPTIYKTRVAFTNPNRWTRIAINHLKSRDCPRQVSHVLTKRERLPGCWRRHSSFSFVLCSLTPHLRISHCFFLTFQSLKWNFAIRHWKNACQHLTRTPPQKTSKLYFAIRVRPPR